MTWSIATRLRITGALFSAVLGAAGAVVWAQAPRGGEIRFPPVSTAEEQLSQSDLWVLDVYFKPMRLISYERTDPKTKEKKLEHAWYIVYRAFNHKLEIKGRENPAVNELDRPVAPPQFVPEATLVTTDNNRNEAFEDQIIPEAIAAINKREKGNYKNSVSIVGPIPEPSEPGNPSEKAIEGVFVWRAVDPDANRYTVYLTGFSNGLRKIDGPDGKPVIQTKTIVQKYWRRGDRFDQNEQEIVLDDEEKGEPVRWIYR